MILYLDSSALVKLYADEPGTDRVRAAAAEARLLACHLVGYVECRAAFARKARQGGISARDHERCKARFELDWKRLHVVAVTTPLATRAADLAERFALRGYDSMHLAAAEALAQAAPGTDYRVAVFDERLAAARGLGLVVLE